MLSPNVLNNLHSTEAFPHRTDVIPRCTDVLKCTEPTLYGVIVTDRGESQRPSVHSGVVSRHNRSIKIDFPLVLMVYHRKISTFIKKQNALANCASIKESIQPFLVKSALKSLFLTNSVLIVEVEPVKS